MWSNSEHIDSTINALLFLLAINFLHLGQVLLPLICLIIFIDHKGKFHVSNWITFILLCLFGVTFFAFSYKTGFYSTMGLCLPMAYYIGSNFKKKDEISIKKVIYLLVFGMATHLLLNLIYEIAVDGIDLFSSLSHYDVWTGDYIPTTATATNCVMIVSLFYYLLLHEKDKRLKTLGLVLFVLIVFYDIALGRRTPLFLGLICFIVALLMDMFVFKNKNINRESIVIAGVCLWTIIVVGINLYVFNLFGTREFILNLGIVKKFLEYGLDTGRLDIFFKAIELMPNHLWGGQEIHDILGIQVHDLWMDTYDYAGIIPFVLLIIHSICFVFTFIRLIKKEKISSDFKFFIFILFFAIAIQLFLEPIMSGSSLFLIVIVLIESILENKLVYERK